MVLLRLLKRLCILCLRLEYLPFRKSLPSCTDDKTYHPRVAPRLVVCAGRDVCVTVGTCHCCGTPREV